MDLRMEQKAERRERILAAAREMIGGRGYAALTMRELAQASRVTVPTIYNLIGGKEAVLFAAIQQQTASFLAAIDTARPASPAAQALSVVESCSRELLRLPSYYRSLLAILSTGRAAAEMRELVDKALNDEFERAIAAMRAAGDLAEWVDPATLAQSLTSQLQFTSMRWAAGELDTEGLRATALYGAGLLLLAVARGKSENELATQVARAQDRISAVQCGAERHAGLGS